MPDDVAEIVRFGANEPLLEFPDEGLVVSVPLTRVCDRMYRLDGVPIFVESAAFGDVIEAEPVEGDRLRFVRVVTAGGWQTYDYMFPAYKLDGEWAQTLLAELTVQGGHWERVFGGLLFVCIPPGIDIDPKPWVETVWVFH